MFLFLIIFILLPTGIHRNIIENHPWYSNRKHWNTLHNQSLQSIKNSPQYWTVWWGSTKIWLGIGSLARCGIQSSWRWVIIFYEKGLKKFNQIKVFLEWKQNTLRSTFSHIWSCWNYVKKDKLENFFHPITEFISDKFYFFGNNIIRWMKEKS